MLNIFIVKKVTFLELIVERMSAAAQLQTQVEQLRQEASLNRLKLSESLKE